MKHPAAPHLMHPIAIVGLGALFPGSTTVKGYWRDIVEARDLLTEVPRTHWLPEDYFDPRPGTPDKVYATRGGFLPAVDFSPLEFGMPPNAVASTDTAQLLALVVAKRVLDEATRGRHESMDRSRMSVILGVASATELVAHMSGRLQRPVWEYAMRQAGLDDGEVARVGKVLDGCYVPWQESTFPGLLGNVVAGRIANRLDLGGTNAVVDAACAGSLGAIAMAVNELAIGHSDLVISGGVDALNDILMYMCFAQTGALSLSGDCRPFSDRADGTMLGEGIGMLALKRLRDAELDGDAIYAVIRGLGSSSDGRAKSIYAPSARGQTLALRRAYERAGYGADTVGLVEAHGTGTAAGDLAEFEALREVFEAAGARVGGCVLGSVKSQIGHTKGAAGAAGIIKAVLALHHKVLPPTLKVAAPNPQLAIETSPFRLITEPRPWVHADPHPRRASVSALGFGGTNFHVTLEEYRGPSAQPPHHRVLPSELLLLSADSPAALAAAAREAAGCCTIEGALEHLARRSQAAFDASAAARLSVVASDEADAREKLAFAAETIEKTVAAGGTAFNSPRGIAYGTGAAEGGVALLFPGQGSQYVGMGGDLATHFDAMRSLLDMATETVGEPSPGETLAARLFPASAFDDAARAAQARQLAATEWAQPAIAATSLGLLRMLDLCGVRGDRVAGHSLGEITALVAAGLFDERTGVAVARRRGELMAAASDIAGVMSAVASDPATVAACVAGVDVVLANHNSPTQVVISGAITEVEKAEQALQRADITVRRLEVSTAFHSPLVHASVQPFDDFLRGVPSSPMTRPCFAAATALPYPADAASACAQLAAAIAEPVRFVDQVEALYAAGTRIFIEVGPHSVLSRLTERCLAGRPHTAVPLDQHGKNGVTSFFMALGRLAAAGIPMALDRLWEGHALPEDPASRKPPAFTLRLTGANYDKPYPPREPEIRVQRPARAAVAAPPAASTMPVNDATAAALPQPDEATTTMNSTDWTDALQRLQAPTIAAQMEFQRLMAESHMAFLRTVQQGYGTVVSGAHLALAPPPAQVVNPPMDMPIPAPIVNALPAPPPSILPSPPPRSQPAPVLESAAVQPAPVVPPAAGKRPTMDLQPLLLAIVAEKTGYPAEMIDTDMDMEADLGIDSIKRVEILSAMRQQVPDLPQVPTDRMASMRTLAQFIELFAGAGGVAGAVAQPTARLAEAPAQASGAPASGVDLQPLLLAIVAEKTGYPAEMIDTDMDMEADLGIDSIKRVEILSAMRQQVPDLPQVPTDRMASMRTLTQIIELFAGGDGDLRAAQLGDETSQDPASAVTLPESSAPLTRHTVRARAAPALGFALPPLLDGRCIAVTRDGAGVAAALVARLQALGVAAIEAAADAIPPEAGGVVFLGGLRPVADDTAALAVNREAFQAARAVAARLREDGGLFVTVQDTGGKFGLDGRDALRAWMGGIAALARTAHHEWPLAVCKALDIQRGERSTTAVASSIADELFGGGPELDVGLTAAGERFTLESVPCEVAPPREPLPTGAVFVVTGGARGVTAASLVALARAVQPRLLILGRTPLADEPEAYRTATGDADLKRIALAEAQRAGRSVAPRDIGREVDGILAAREVRNTLAELAATGAQVRYEAVDVRDAAALSVLLDGVRRQWGPIQGVVHGAGVLADATIDRKTDDQFDRVFDTKVLGLRALLAATSADPLRWICLFSSVAARSGNAGQADYAMANEVLNKVAAVEARRRAGTCRVVAIGWGPWDGGMVTPALRAHFAERGVPLVPVAAGAAAFVAELMAPPADDVEIVIGGAPGLEAWRARADGVLGHVHVTVDANSHPQLRGHRIQGQPVLPMVLVLEWFARLGRALLPGRATVQLRDLRVTRGIVLSNYDGAGDRFRLLATAHAQGLAFELWDVDGSVRYTALLEVGERPAQARIPTGATPHGASLDRGEIYGPDALFHGREFQVIRSIEGVSSSGGWAMLDTIGTVAWPSEPWATDPAALDGALQLAILCGLRSIGPVLPMRIGQVAFTRGAATGPLHCALVVHGRSAERIVCDVALTDGDGRPVADLVDVEMYAVPSRSTAAKPLMAAGE